MAVPEDQFKKHLEMNRKVWDAFQPVWAEATRKKRSDRDESSENGHDVLDPLEVELIGDVRSQNVLSLSCAWDACQAFALSKLGATVTACDISLVAIDMARQRARDLGHQVEFVVCDSQTLRPMDDDSFDLVFAQYNYCYYEDLPAAFTNWFRVLREGGRLFVREGHPFTSGLEEKNGILTVVRSYFERKPDYYQFNGIPAVPADQSDLQAVEFPHTLSDFVNAMAQAGFRIDRMVETEHWDHRDLSPGLPVEVFMMATKPRRFDSTPEKNRTRRLR